MKIFFYSNIEIENEASGIRNKVFEQIKSLRESKHEVYYCGYLDNKVVIIDNNNEIVIENILTNTTRFNQRKNLLKLCIQFLKETTINFQVGYVRYHYFDYFFNKLLKSMNKNDMKVIVEAHGYPVFTSKSVKRLPMAIVDQLHWRSASKYIDLVSAISNYTEIWNSKTVFMDNAVNIEDYKVLPYKKITNDVHLFCAATERPYHGYSKLIKGLYEYQQKNPKIRYHITFAGSYFDSTIQLVEDLNMQDTVKFIGKIPHNNLRDHLSNADLGLGSFNRHAGSEYGSSIKSKEYFAYGLPFLNGWKEYAFDDNYPYVYRFDVDDRVIDFNKVDEFVNSLKGHEKDYRYEMREFAEENFTWEQQFEKVFGEL